MEEEAPGRSYAWHMYLPLPERKKQQTHRQQSRYATITEDAYFSAVLLCARPGVLDRLAAFTRCLPLYLPSSLVE